jgi:integrase
MGVQIRQYPLSPEGCGGKMPLTDVQVRAAMAIGKPRKLTDAGGLYLEVRPSGQKLWRYRFRVGGKESIYAIGQYFVDRRPGHVSLEEARRLRDEARVLVRGGTSPVRHRQAARAAQIEANTNTFEAVALERVAKHGHWSPYYQRQVTGVLRADIFPKLGAHRVDQINAAQILGVVKAIEGRGATTIASLALQWCSAIFRYAVATLRAIHDPAAALRGAVKRQRTKHHRPLSRAEIQSLLAALDKSGGFRTTVIAIRLLLLTFVRPGELRGAGWSELDLDQKIWRIPETRMKMREPHVVPLSTQVVALLKELHALTGGRDILFPNHRRPQQCMSTTTINRALERMGFNGKGSIGFSAHGFRATASTMLNELGYRTDVIERQLAHKERNRVRASYNQAEYLAERTAMMQEWADLLDAIERGGDTVVVPLVRTSRNPASMRAA